MQLEIITPETNLFSGEVVAVQLPGKDGLFQVLNSHAPIISTLEKGMVKLTGKDGKMEFEITGGVIEVLNNKVIVLAESI